MTVDLSHDPSIGLTFTAGCDSPTKTELSTESETRLLLRGSLWGRGDARHWDEAFKRSSLDVCSSTDAGGLEVMVTGVGKLRRKVDETRELHENWKCPRNVSTTACF